MLLVRWHGGDDHLCSATVFDPLFQRSARAARGHLVYLIRQRIGIRCRWGDDRFAGLLRQCEPVGAKAKQAREVTAIGVPYEL